MEPITAYELTWLKGSIRLRRERRLAALVAKLRSCFRLWTPLTAVALLAFKVTYA